MVTKAEIERFYKDVESLGLKFPGARIVEVTGESKGNVSRILNRKMEPSGSFLNKFYNGFKTSVKAFPDDSNKTENVPPAAFLGITAQEYIEELRRDKRRLESVIDANLTALVTMLSALHRHDLASHQVMLRSLARLEKLKDREQLIEEADRIEGEFQLREAGKGSVEVGGN